MAVPESFFRMIVDRIKDSVGLDVIYGKERVIKDRAIIPIGRVAYAFGAWGGQGPRGAEGEPAGVGGGGGSRVTVEPVACLEVTDEETKLIPVVNRRLVVAAGLVGFVAGMIWARRRR
ncbi:MAG: GerW family sporulation protein [bacterium]